MDVNKIAGIEALLFTAEEPVSITEIADTIDMTISEVKDYIKVLKKEYNQKKFHGIKLIKYDNSYIFGTKSHLAPYIKKLHDITNVTNLSQAALETLAIIAYKQPVTRSVIEEIRGVKVERTINTLKKYNLIKDKGRKDTTGNPILYGTTEEFLKQFNLNAVSDLPEINKKLLDKKDI